MSKEQVWEIIFFFHTNRPKEDVFPDWKMTKKFSTLQHCVGTLHVNYRSQLTHPSSNALYLVGVGPVLMLCPVRCVAERLRA